MSSLSPVPQPDEANLCQLSTENLCSSEPRSPIPEETVPQEIQIDVTTHPVQLEVDEIRHETESSMEDVTSSVKDSPVLPLSPGPDVYSPVAQIAEQVHQMTLSSPLESVTTEQTLVDVCQQIFETGDSQAVVGDVCEVASPSVTMAVDDLISNNTTFTKQSGQEGSTFNEFKDFTRDEITYGIATLTDNETVQSPLDHQLVDNTEVSILWNIFCGFCKS